jgi:hypothetical protein
MYPLAIKMWRGRCGGIHRVMEGYGRMQREVWRKMEGNKDGRKADIKMFG